MSAQPPRLTARGETEVPVAVEVLINQYYAAVDLYKHEDSLNWQKVNHLLYVNAALGAIVGFVLERQSSNLLALTPPQVMIIVSTVGLLVSAGFGVAVWFGTHYLNNRKLAVRAVEKRLIQYGGVRVVSPLPGVVASKFQRISPTIWVLRLVPMGFMLLWSGLLMLALLRLGG